MFNLPSSDKNGENKYKKNKNSITLKSEPLKFIESMVDNRS